MEHTTCDGHIADYARSAAYEKALTSSEIIKAVTHFRHFRDKKYRKTWLSRARACDKIGRARLSVGRVADAYCGRRIVFVGPELAGNGLAVPEAAVSLARDLNALGCTVDLVTRVLPSFFLPSYWRWQATYGSFVRFRPTRRPLRMMLQRSSPSGSRFPYNSAAQASGMFVSGMPVAAGSLTATL